MASLRDGLEKLEAYQVAGQWEVPVYLMLYLKELENIQREERGEEPIPLTPTEQTERAEGDRWFVEEYIPRIRAQGGSPETLAMIEELEEHAREGQTNDEESLRPSHVDE